MCRVQLSINAISWINLYPVDNTVDFVTASPQHIVICQAPVVQNERRITLYIYWINLYPQDNTIGFLNTYPLNSDLSDIWGYSTLEQTGPCLVNSVVYLLKDRGQTI